MSGEVLAVIPARSGSKGLPDKNIKTLIDKPLIAWSIQQAKTSEHIDEFLVSTDSRNYARIAEEYGAPAPFIRPDDLAQDDSPTSRVLAHAIEWNRNRGRVFDLIVLLEPTSPIRKPNDVDNAIELFREYSEKADSLVSVGEVELEHPFIVKDISDMQLSPFVEFNTSFHQRQQLPPAHFPYGVIYLSKVDTYEEEMSFYQDRTIPYEIERWQNYEIDDIYDFLCVERIIEHLGTEVEGYE